MCASWRVRFNRHIPRFHTPDLITFLHPSMTGGPCVWAVAEVLVQRLAGVPAAMSSAVAVQRSAVAAAARGLGHLLRLQHAPSGSPACAAPRQLPRRPSGCASAA